MSITYLLDFTLIVETFDHQIIEQTPDDTSRFTPDRSFYYDIQGLHLKKASLVGKGHVFTIDLVDGHAEINGRKFYPPQSPPIGSKFKLLYYRQVQQRTTMDLEGQTQHTPVVRYFLGWRIDGTNKTWEMGVD